MGTMSGEATLSLSFLPPFPLVANFFLYFLPVNHPLTLLHSERPKLYGILAVLCAIRLNEGLTSQIQHLRQNFTWKISRITV